jgi:hypothetical protein
LKVRRKLFLSEGLTFAKHAKVLDQNLVLLLPLVEVVGAKAFRQSDRVHS